MSQSRYPYDLAREAARVLRERLPFLPAIAITLGTGGGGGDLFFEENMRIPFPEIPHFPSTSVQSHRGELILGRLGEIPLVCLSGRYHYYEGQTMATIVHPVRTLGLLGCKGFIFTNAAGGLHPDQEAGDLVLLRDHINLLPDNPLRGPNDERLGPRFPDMLHAYDPDWRQAAHRSADALCMVLREGVYAALPGPNLETPAEYRYLHGIGADLVGMSTVPEVIAARHMGLRVAAVSVVSNVCYPEHRIRATSVEDVIAAVAAAREKLYRLLHNWIPRMDR
jgi:purine-nucleoside phosphorylase